MDRQELPEYKQNFLSEMEELRRQQWEAENQLNQTGMQTAQRIENPPNPNNNIINTSQYSSSEWRQKLNQTSFQDNHNDSHFKMNLMMNPEVGKKQNNIRSTQISEYSNARHNNTVFVNPKNTSC